MRRVWVCLGLLISVFLAACSQSNEGTVTPPANGVQPQPTLTTPSATPIPQPTPLPPAVSIESPPGSITLTIWTNTEISAFGDAPGDQLLREQITAFDADRPGLQLSLSQKALSGQGSLLSYLRTARAVAPTILPDLVLLPTNQLSSAAADQLVYPLDNLLDPGLVADLYPAADQLGRINGMLMGYPLALRGLSHLAYNPENITGTLPLTWAEFTTQDSRLILPAAGPEGARLALQFYLALNGPLTNEANQPALRADILTQALTLLSQGRSSGLILLNSSNVATVADAWQLFQNGQASTTLVTAAAYLAQSSQGIVSRFAPIPGIEGTLPPLVDGWVWAITTTDPARQRAAADLLTWLADKARHGDWSWQSGALPAQRGAFSRWPAGEPYIVFLQQELERAQPVPVQASSIIMTALSDAVFDVISLQSAPETAADAAAAAVNN